MRHYGGCTGAEHRGFERLELFKPSREMVLDGKQGVEMLWFEFVGATLDLKPKLPAQSSALPAPGSAVRAGRQLGPLSMALLTAALPSV